MKVPDVMEKVLEKIKDMSGISSIPEDKISFGIKVDVELDENQYNELINMLNSMGYKSYNTGAVGQGLVMEIYYNSRTREFIAIYYMKYIKHKIDFIIYYRGIYEVYT